MRKTRTLKYLLIILFFYSVQSQADHHWETCSKSDERPDFYDIYFLDSQNGWICGDFPYIARTKDGGLTWQREHLPDFEEEKSERPDFAVNWHQYCENDTIPLYFKTGSKLYLKKMSANLEMETEWVEIKKRETDNEHYKALKTAPPTNEWGENLFRPYKSFMFFPTDTLGIVIDHEVMTFDYGITDYMIRNMIYTRNDQQPYYLEQYYSFFEFWFQYSKVEFKNLLNSALPYYCFDEEKYDNYEDPYKSIVLYASPLEGVFICGSEEKFDFRHFGESYDRKKYLPLYEKEPSEKEIYDVVSKRSWDPVNKCFYYTYDYENEIRLYGPSVSYSYRQDDENNMDIYDVDSWSPREVQKMENILSMDFFNLDIGYCLNEDYFFYRTDNGAKTWEPCAEFYGEEINSYDEWYYSCRLVGNDGFTAFYHYGDKDWKTIMDSPAVHLNTLDFWGPEEGLVAGRFGIIEKTLDGGKTFYTVSDSMRNEIHDLKIINDSVVLAVGYGKAILRSKDRGENWSLVSN